jgi:hypothetical protein
MNNLHIEEAFKTHNEETNSLTLLDAKNTTIKQDMTAIYSTV